MEQRDFGIKVRQLREQKGLLLRQIAAALEVDTALVSKIERGERKASKEQIMKIAELLEINPDELLVIWLSFVLLLLRLYGFDLPQGVSLGLRVSELAP